MKIKLITTTFFLTLLTGCVTTNNSPSLTPLEIRSIQTRSYEAEYNVVFRSVVAVFQDLGYTIKSADISTGFIQADGAADSNEALKFWTGMTSTSQTKASGFVEQIGDATNARLSFIKSVESSTAYGADSKEEEPILDSQIYQNAFERVENAIFVRTSTN
jgi:hypothetical protein